MSRFAPMEAKDCSTWALAPSPIATMAITAETPMITPNVVRNERSLLRKRAYTATRKVSSGVIGQSPLSPVSYRHQPSAPHGGYRKGCNHLSSSLPEKHIRQCPAHV